MMILQNTSIQAVETSITTNNSPSQDYIMCARLAQLAKSLTVKPEGPGFNPRPGQGLNFGRLSFATPSMDRDVKPLALVSRHSIVGL